MEGGPKLESNIFPQTPAGLHGSSSQTEKIGRQLLSVDVVSDYKKYAAELISVDLTVGLDKEIDHVKQNPLPQVEQGEDIELLKLNDYIREVNTAAQAGDKTLFKKAVQHLQIFLDTEEKTEPNFSDISKPKPENQYEKFLGFHDYKSGAFRVLDFILKKHGPEALLEEIQKNPLPTFKEYFDSTKDVKPELHTKITHDIALNSHGENKIIQEFNMLISKLNGSVSGQEAEEAYKKLTDFFARYSNSLQDNLN